MSGFWDTLGKVSNILEEVNESVDTTNYGINKAQSSKGKLDRALNRIKTGEDVRDRKRAEVYDRKGNRWINWTIVLCIISIIATIVVCIFM